MVMFLYILPFLWLGTVQGAPFVDASVDSMKAQAHFPIEGTVTITHNKDEKIDPQSFKMEGKQLETSYIKEVKMAGEILLTIYSFQLPPKEKGLYVLPSISVTINGQQFQSIPSTYTIKNGTEQLAPKTVTEKIEQKTPAIFRLEASVKGPSTLFPGERTQLFYRISYNRDIDLSRTDLPMVHPQHLRKIGDVQIRDYQEPTVTVQEITQEVEALDIGSFQFGPSEIEGYTYTIKGGQKVYDHLLLKAEAPVITIDVKPFPQNQPASFTGALGQIRAQATLVSAHAVSIGENIQADVTIQGVTNLTDLRLPLLQCQPGFSGFFQMSDLPPLAEMKDNNSKIFHIELRPLTPLVDQIPSIEVSSFDPSTGKYIIQNTQPLPLKVEGFPREKTISRPLPKIAPLPAVGKWPTPLLSPLELTEEMTPIKDLQPFWIKSFSVAWLIPIAIVLLLLQKWMHDQWQKYFKLPLSKSEELFHIAMKKDSLKSLHSLHLLEHAIWHRLWEKKIVPEGVYQLDLLAEKNRSIRSFLSFLQALQYSEEKHYDPLQLKKLAQSLFQTINEANK